MCYGYLGDCKRIFLGNRARAKALCCDKRIYMKPPWGEYRRPFFGARSVGADVYLGRKFCDLMILVGACMEFVIGMGLGHFLDSLGKLDDVSDKLDESRERVS